MAARALATDTIRDLMLIDTHCHLDFKEFDRDRDEVVERAGKAGVGFIINVGSSLEGSARAHELSRAYETVYFSAGIHPHDAGTLTDEAFASIERLAASPKAVAIGEVGLDYYRNLSGKDEQRAAYRKFIALADRLGLPLIIHTREAGHEALDILMDGRSGPAKGVVHCFSGDAAMLKRCLEAGLYVSFTCNLTFRNAKALRRLAEEVPVERLLLETDAPYLAPEGMRGERNEPAAVRRLAGEWARIKALSAEDIARITTHNAARLFGLPFAEEPKVAYRIRDSLYLNITNRCTNECGFCVRNTTDFVKGHFLRLGQEPTAEEILRAAQDQPGCKEVVFCGYGEPTLRLDEVKAVARALKEKGAATRLVTNGHGDLINGRPIAGELRGLIDRVSVSLNVDSKEVYAAVCRPRFGPDAYDAVIAFARACVAAGIDTEITCLDLPQADPVRCKAIAAAVGARFRGRTLGVTG